MKVSLFDKIQKRSGLLCWIGISLFSIFVFLLLIPGLDDLSMWMDEGFYYLAPQKILEFGYPLYPSGHIYFKAILYAYAMAFFTLIFGFKVFNLRLFSLLSTVALIPVVYLLGKRMFNRIIGMGAVVVFALCIWVAEYSRVGLYFAPLQLISVLGVYLFYRGFFEEETKFKILATVTILASPLIHQLGMGVWFCYPAFFLTKGWKRFFRRDILVSFSLTTLFYLLVQVHEFFFWRVGYVYEKTDLNIGGMIQYFFTGFSTTFFRELYLSFPKMSLIVCVGLFLCIGGLVLDHRKNRRSTSAFYSNWLFLSLCLLFPLLFLGFFRTHIQPRYLYQVYPIFVVLYVLSLYTISRVFIDLLLFPFRAKKTALPTVISTLLFIGFLFFTVEGVSLSRVKRIVNRKYGDPVQTNIIYRSGRREHYDYSVGEYVRHFLNRDDRVVAIHVVFGYIYAGRVDYWLWSGGPGTWDAWEQTTDGWKDFYIGARWINNLSDLKRILEENKERRVWIITSPSIFKTDHIKTEIAQFIKADPNKLVFRGKDEMSEVYLWNEASGQLTGTHHTLEGEWFPVLFGQNEYRDDSSKGCTLYLDKEEVGNKLYQYRTRQSFAPGRYRMKFRMKANDVSQGKRLFGIAVGKREGGNPEASYLVSADMIVTQNRYQDFEFSFYHRKEEPLHLKLMFTGEGNVWLDYVDILPVTPHGELSKAQSSAASSKAMIFNAR